MQRFIGEFADEIASDFASCSVYGELAEARHNASRGDKDLAARQFGNIVSKYRTFPCQAKIALEELQVLANTNPRSCEAITSLARCYDHGYCVDKNMDISTGLYISETEHLFRTALQSENILEIIANVKRLFYKHRFLLNRSKAFILDYKNENRICDSYENEMLENFETLIIRLRTTFGIPYANLSAQIKEFKRIFPMLGEHLEMYCAHMSIIVPFFASLNNALADLNKELKAISWNIKKWGTIMPGYPTGIANIYRFLQAWDGAMEASGEQNTFVIFPEIYKVLAAKKFDTENDDSRMPQTIAFYRHFALEFSRLRFRLHLRVRSLSGTHNFFEPPAAVRAPGSPQETAQYLEKKSPRNHNC